MRGRSGVIVNNGDTSLDLWEVGGITGSLSVTSVSHNCE